MVREGRRVVVVGREGVYPDRLTRRGSIFGTGESRWTLVLVDEGVGSSRVESRIVDQVVSSSGSRQWVPFWMVFHEKAQPVKYSIQYSTRKRAIDSG